jgi:hypothetical protein
MNSLIQVDRRLNILQPLFQRFDDPGTTLRRVPQNLGGRSAEPWAQRRCQALHVTWHPTQITQTYLCVLLRAALLLEESDQVPAFFRPGNTEAHVIVRVH